MFFKDVLVPEHIKQQLIQTVQDNRISHAQLFAGIEGTHKFALAIAYAQYINCTNKQEHDSCGECPSCKKFAKLAHPDLHIVFPTAEGGGSDGDVAPSRKLMSTFRDYVLENDYHLSFDDWLAYTGTEKKQGTIYARDCDYILEQLATTSYEAEYKVMVIWKIEKMFHAAIPKLLKILEEPAPKTLFLLLSENTDLVLNTILSRSQLLKIKPMDTQLIINTLTTQYGATSQAAEAAAKLSEGNFIQAKRLVSDSTAISNNNKLFQDYLRCAYAIEAPGMVEKLNSIIDSLKNNSREVQKTFFINGLRVIRQCILLNSGTAQLVNPFDEEQVFIEKFHPFVNLNNGEQIVAEFNKAIYHVERNGNISIILMDLALSLNLLLHSSQIK